MQTYWWLASLAICRIWCLAAPLESDAGAAERQETAQEVLRRYAAAASIRQTALKGVDMDVTIHARLLRLNKEGLLQAVRHVACNGQVSYRIVNFLGDGTIRREAIARYLAADIEASHEDRKSVV